MFRPSTGTKKKVAFVGSREVAPPPYQKRSENNMTFQKFIYNNLFVNLLEKEKNGAEYDTVLLLK